MTTDAETILKEKENAKEAEERANKAQADADKAIREADLAKTIAADALKHAEDEATKIISKPVSNEDCSGNACAGCAHLRDDFTHIAVKTDTNQLVTVDMPMTEAKRITVK